MKSSASKDVLFTPYLNNDGYFKELLQFQPEPRVWNLLTKLGEGQVVGMSTIAPSRWDQVSSFCRTNQISTDIVAVIDTVLQLIPFNTTALLVFRI